MSVFSDVSLVKDKQNLAYVHLLFGNHMEKQNTEILMLVCLLALPVSCTSFDLQCLINFQLIQCNGLILTHNFFIASVDISAH